MPKTKMLKAHEYGARLPEPLGGAMIRKYCRAGRIPGAKSYGKFWLIPENAEITPAGVQQRNNQVEGLTVREYADKYKVSTMRIYRLLKAGKIAGAVKTEYGWSIPPEAEYPAAW